MSRRIPGIRGMNDLLPEVIVRWQHLEATARSVLEAYGYREIRIPLLEKTELFSRSIGQQTDIVAKEMYTFEDRNGDSITLRPEATAGIVRAGIEHGLLRNRIQRLWHAGPMFRHERPQKGRYRQFYQIDVEAFGMPGPDIDAELIFLTARLWRELGIQGLRLEINSLGTPEARAAYRKDLVRYFEGQRHRLDDDSLRRLDKNPLRILDSKNPNMEPIIAGAPSLLDYLDVASQDHFDRLKKYLDAAEIPYVVTNRLVRGLDYYTHTVFEWTTQQLGAQGAVCGGGRYDGLVELLGGKPTPATGFALGMERLVELVSQSEVDIDDRLPQAYLVILGGFNEIRDGIPLAESLRNAGLRVECNCGGGSVKSQMRRAHHSGATFALLLGDDERRTGKITVKNLRVDVPQEQIPWSDVAAYLKQRLS